MWLLDANMDVHLVSVLAAAHSAAILVPISTQFIANWAARPIDTRSVLHAHQKQPLGRRGCSTPLRHYAEVLQISAPGFKQRPHNVAYHVLQESAAADAVAQFLAAPLQNRGKDGPRLT